jgi:hypothetical protein
MYHADITGSGQYHVTASFLSDVELVQFAVIVWNHKVALVMIRVIRNDTFKVNIETGDGIFVEN